MSLHSPASRLWANIVAIPVVASSLVACQSGYRTMAKSVVADCSVGNYEAAAKASAAAAEKIKPDDPDRLAYVLEAGRCAQLAGDQLASDQFLTEAAAIVRPYLDTKAEAKVTEAVATTAVNQTVSIYRGTNPERMWISTLLAMNAMQRGDAEEARRLFIGASEWQQNASAINEREIAEQQEAVDRDQKEATEKQLEVASTAEVVENDAYANLEALNATASFEDPFTTYLQSIFLMFQRSSSDLAAADNGLDRLVQYHAGVPAVAALVDGDKAIHAQLNSKGRVQPTTWVFLFEGLAAHREELKLAVAAFPRMTQLPEVTEKPSVMSAGVAAEMVQISDVDRLVMTDFKLKLPMIITQELLSTALKTTVTVVAQRELGALGGLGALAYQVASTSADLRGWRTLPKRVWVARVATPEDGTIELRDGEASMGAVSVRPGSTGVIFVDLPGRSASPVLRSADLIAPLEEKAS